MGLNSYVEEAYAEIFNHLLLISEKFGDNPNVFRMGEWFKAKAEFVLAMESFTPGLILQETSVMFLMSILTTIDFIADGDVEASGGNDNDNKVRDASIERELREYWYIDRARATASIDFGAAQDTLRCAMMSHWKKEASLPDNDEWEIVSKVVQCPYYACAEQSISLMTNIIAMRGGWNARNRDLVERQTAKSAEKTSTAIGKKFQRGVNKAKMYKRMTSTNTAQTGLAAGRDYAGAAGAGMAAIGALISTVTAAQDIAFVHREAPKLRADVETKCDLVSEAYKMAFKAFNEV